MQIALGDELVDLTSGLTRRRGYKWICDDKERKSMTRGNRRVWHHIKSQWLAWSESQYCGQKWPSL